MKILTLLIAQVVFSAFGADLSLTWNPSTDSSVTNYVLYGSTNDLSMTNITVRVNAGNTNLVTLQDIKPAHWQFAVTAKTTPGVESDFSNILSVDIAPPPTGLHTIIMQQSADLTNWTDFFRLKITTP